MPHQGLTFARVKTSIVCDVNDTKWITTFVLLCMYWKTKPSFKNSLKNLNYAILRRPDHRRRGLSGGQVRNGPMPIPPSCWSQTVASESSFVWSIFPALWKIYIYETRRGQTLWEYQDSGKREKITRVECSDNWARCVDSDCRNSLFFFHQDDD